MARRLKLTHIPHTANDIPDLSHSKNHLRPPSRLSPISLSFGYVHHHDHSSKSMIPASTTRRPSGNGSSDRAVTHKGTAKRGLKRPASREAINPRERKRPRRNEPDALPPTQRPRQLQIAPVRNVQKRPSHNIPPRLFVWGCGDDGSLGLGPDRLEEIPRPQRLHQRGITSIAAGGLYTLLLDRDGKVSASSTLYS